MSKVQLGVTVEYGDNSPIETIVENGEKKEVSGENAIKASTKVFVELKSLGVYDTRYTRTEIIIDGNVTIRATGLGVTGQVNNVYIQVVYS